MTEDQLKEFSKKIDALSDNVKSLEAKINKEGKKDSNIQWFLFFWGLFVGLITGAFGNLWATITFEYFKGDNSLQFNFCISSILFGVMAVVFIILSYMVFWKGYKKARNSSQDSPEGLK